MFCWLAHSKQKIGDTEELSKVLEELEVTNDYLEINTSKLEQFETTKTSERPFSFAKRLTGKVGELLTPLFIRPPTIRDGIVSSLDGKLPLL